MSSCLAGRRRPVEFIAESDQASSAVMTFEKLPLEILQLVAEFLPVDSAACLALSNKFLASAIGTRSWSTLRSRKFRGERRRFIVSIQRDIEEWLFLCHHCVSLHSVKRTPLLHRQWFDLHRSPCSWANGIIEYLPNYILRWQHAHEIMKLDKLNSTDNHWLNALSHAVFRRGVPYAHCSARIADGNLLLKVEYRILLHHDEGFPQVELLFPQVCPHWTCGDDDRGLSKLLRCRLSHETNNPCAECAKMIQCRWCATEFIISFLDSTWSFNGRVIYITAWKDLGSCLTSHDRRWRSHTPFTSPRSFFPEALAHFRPDSIRSAFEEYGSPKLKDGLAIISPLDSDLEFSKQIDERSRQGTQYKQSTGCSKTEFCLPPLDFSLMPSLEESMFSK